MTPQKSAPKVCYYSGSLVYQFRVSVVATRVALSLLALPALLVPFRVVFVVMLIYSTQYHHFLNLMILCSNRGIPMAYIWVL